MSEKTIPWKTIIIGAIIALAIAYYAFDNIRTARIEASTVVARVNGEAIYESDVNHGLADDSFDSTTSDMKNNKIARLISQVAIRQYLSKQGIRTNEDLVDKEVRKMEANPPSMGCPCCTYKSLDDYLVTIGYTRDNLSADIRNDIGLSQYAKISWKKSHPNSSDTLKLIGNDSKYIRQHYINACQVFFNTFQQPGFNSDPSQIKKAASKKAQKAWERIQHGEAFDAVAKSVSEDMTSKHKGGSLGFIDKSSYGQEFADTVSHLKPGTYSKPFESSWGYHIIKWQPMSDDDIVKFCESYFINKEFERLRAQIMKSAKVEMIKKPDNGA